MTEDACSEDEWTAFYEIANAFIHKANTLSAAELTDEAEIGAALRERYRGGLAHRVSLYQHVPRDADEDAWGALARGVR